MCSTSLKLLQFAHISEIYFISVFHIVYIAEYDLKTNMNTYIFWLYFQYKYFDVIIFVHVQLQIWYQFKRA